MSTTIETYRMIHTGAKRTFQQTKSQIPSAGRTQFDALLHEDMFAWEVSECGHFKEDFFPPVDIPVIPHTPWVQRNIPIPPGFFDEVCCIIKEKIDSGVMEPSNLSYCTRWFNVVKRNGKSLCPMLALEALNAVTIRHSGVPPFTEKLAEQFVGHACGSMLNLFIRYDECALAPSSRDLTTFQTSFGAMCLMTLPMGWTIQSPSFMKMLLTSCRKRFCMLPSLTLAMCQSENQQSDI